MATETSNIDDLLTGNVSAQQEIDNTTYEDDELSPEEVQNEPESAQNEDTQESEHNDESEETEQTERKQPEQDLDDYGNPKKPPKTYTQDEVNEMFRRRFKNHPPEVQQQVQQVQNQGFEYDPESSESWQGQLERFVEATVSKMTQKQAQQQMQEKEHQAQVEFESKFIQGMERFSDFRDVVGAQPIDDPMTYALRGMSDPAAFIYAAAKRQPAELARISNIQDPYAKMVEMGKLEERMRKTASSTKAPRPVSRHGEDGTIPLKSAKKEETIDDLISQSDAKRRAQLVAKRGR